MRGRLRAPVFVLAAEGYHHETPASETLCRDGRFDDEEIFPAFEPAHPAGLQADISRATDVAAGTGTKTAPR